jgi:SAM-dependent methyltransferase
VGISSEAYYYYIVINIEKLIYNTLYHPDMTSCVTLQKETYQFKQEIINLQQIGMLPNLKGKKVLEIGSGVGYGSRLLTELDALVTAIELDSKVAKNGLRLGNYNRVSLLCPKDAKNYDYGMMFDAVFGFHIGPLNSPGMSIPKIWEDVLQHSVQYVTSGGQIFVSYHAGEDTGLPEYLAQIGVKGNAYSRTSQSLFCEIQADAYFIGKI